LGEKGRESEFFIRIHDPKISNQIDAAAAV